MIEPERLSEVVHFDQIEGVYFVDEPGELDSTYYYGEGYEFPDEAYEFARTIWPDLEDDELDNNH